MTANASARAIKPELLRTYTEDFNKDRANLIAADAAVSAGVLKAATDYRGVRALPRDFSIELKQGSITNQERSGRCWMFASLNTLRYELMHRWNLEDFEFSETYLFFWDAMEKSNTYLENVLRTLDEATDSRLFEAINESPADDGGWWQMFAALVNKYGLVPKSAYPESENSRNSDDFKQYLNSKLREFAAELRNWPRFLPPDVGGGAVNDIAGRALVVHASEDDYTSQPAGNAGAQPGSGGRECPGRLLVLLFGLLLVGCPERDPIPLLLQPSVQIGLSSKVQNFAYNPQWRVDLAQLGMGE